MIRVIGIILTLIAIVFALFSINSFSSRAHSGSEFRFLCEYSLKLEVGIVDESRLTDFRKKCNRLKNRFEGFGRTHTELSLYSILVSFILFIVGIALYVRSGKYQLVNDV